MVGCTDGFEAHVSDMKKRGFQTHQIVICEIQHETYIELKQYAEKHYPEIRVFNCDIVLFINFLSQTNNHISYIEADGTGTFKYEFDISLIKLMIDDKNINSLQLVGTTRGNNKAIENMAREFHFKKTKHYSTRTKKCGTKIRTRSKQSDSKYRPSHYIPIVLKSLLENTDIDFHFQTYKGIDTCPMYMINLKR